jgi:hypothetical protein
MVITNTFIGEEVTLDENSVCGYKIMGFKTMGEDEESNIFSLRLEVPMPFSVFGDSYSWAKYGHPILPSNLSISSREKVQLHDPFWKCLQALLQTDLDGNLYSTSNCHTSAKIEVYLSNFVPSHLSNQASGSMFDQLLLHPANTSNLVKFFMERAVGTTTIPMNLFPNLCVKRFPKHSFLKSTLEIQQQFEIQLESHEEFFFLIMGDCSKYSINCVRCKKRITACGSIAETLFHAPVAMLHHLGMIPNFEVLDESGLKAMPLLFTGLDSFTRSKKSHEESVGNKVDDELVPKCLNSKLSIDQQFNLCEAIKVDAFQSEDNGETISSTLSLIKVLFEDLRLGFEIHQQFKTNTPKNVDFNGTKFFY